MKADKQQARDRRGDALRRGLIEGLP